MIHLKAFKADLRIFRQVYRMTDNKTFELNDDGIYMKNSEKVYHVLKQIKQSCPSKLQIIADFDWTLSNYDHHEMTRNPTTFDILQNTGFMPESIKEKLFEMKNIYLPLLMDSEKSQDFKKDLMHEWYINLSFELNVF